MARDEDVLQGGAGVVEGGVHSGEDWEGTRSVGVSERRGVVCLRGDTKQGWGLQGVCEGGKSPFSFALNDVMIRPCVLEILGILSFSYVGMGWNTGRRCRQSYQYHRLASER